jgi:hypothetical protein
VVEIIERAADGVVDVPAIHSLDFDRLTDDCGGPEEPFRMAFMVAGHVGYSLIAPLHGFPHTGDDLAEAVETARGAVYAMAASQDEPDDKQARFYDADTLLAVYRQHLADAAAQSLERQAAELAGQCSLLRCLFGNPLRPLSPLDPSLLRGNGLIVNLARAAYDHRQLPGGTLDPVRLAVLADALEERGAASPLLSHLRSPGPHVRGCVALDAILQRS